MKNPRQIAVEALMQVAGRGAWSNLALDNILRKYDLDSRDSAFVGALFYGVLERLVTLDACIAVHARQPLEKLSPAVLAVLRAGLYQLLYMEGVPDSAAVNESVELVKRLRKAQAAGFVNGVLRAFLRGGKAIPMPEEPLSASLSVEYACPQPLVELWLAGYGEAATRRILAGSLGKPPLYLRVNTTLLSPGELISRLAVHGVAAAEEPDLPGCLVVEGAGAVHKLPEYRRGFFHVQDKSSQLCALALDAGPGMRVLDACAAPGGKTFTLAEILEEKRRAAGALGDTPGDTPGDVPGDTPAGEIAACDLHEHRIRLVADRAKQMKLGGITARAMDMTRFDPALGRFDRVLCDAPCSGLGVIRRKPEIKHKPLAEFEKLPSVQYKILETTAQYCQAGGLLLYSTCTLNPAENQGVTARFRAEHPEFSPAPLPALLGGEWERTILDEFGADGFYLALFRRD